MSEKYVFYDLQLIQYRASNPQSITRGDNLSVTPYEQVIRAIALNNVSDFAAALHEADLWYTDNIPCTWKLTPGECHQKILPLIEIAMFYKSYKVVDFIVINESSYLFSEYSLGLLESHYGMSKCSDLSAKVLDDYSDSLFKLIEQMTDEELVDTLSQFNPVEVKAFCKVVLDQDVTPKNNRRQLSTKFACAVIRGGYASSMNGLNELTDIFLINYITYYAKANLFYDGKFLAHRVDKCLADLNNVELKIFSDAITQINKANRKVGDISGTSSLSLVIKELSLQAILCVIARLATLNHSLHKADLTTSSMSDYIISAVNNIAALDDNSVTTGHLGFLNKVAELSSKDLPQEANWSVMSFFFPATTSKADELRRHLSTISNLAHDHFMQLASTRLGATA